MRVAAMAGQGAPEGKALDKTMAFKAIANFLRNEDAASAIEYAMIAAGIAVVIVSAVRTVGTSVNAMFTSVANLF